MHINCVICSDLFVPSSDVFVTNCGHLFHYPCLTQWIERSSSCPQCRHKTTEKSIQRVYFNVASNENEEDSSLLHNKIDNLKFQLRLKETDVKNVSEENTKVKNQNKGLREEIIKSEERIRVLESTMSSLRDQIRYLKAQNESAEAAVQETKRIRKHLESLKSVETIVQGSMAEVEDILHQHGDSYESRKSLATYVSVLKREVQATSEKKREFRDKLRKCQRELSTANTERERLIEETNIKSKLYKQLEDDFQHTEQEKKSLQRKIHDLEKAISSPNGNNPRDGAIRRLIMESPIPEAVKRPRLTDPSEADTSISVMLGSKPPKQKEKPEPSTPYLKSSNFGLGPLRASNKHLIPTTNKYSIFKKRQTELSSMSGNPEEAYDGLGGHSKLDVFPVPTQRVKSTSNKKSEKIALKKHHSATKRQIF